VELRVDLHRAEPGAPDNSAILAAENLPQNLHPKICVPSSGAAPPIHKLGYLHPGPQARYCAAGRSTDRHPCSAAALFADAEDKRTLLAWLDLVGRTDLCL